MSPFKQNKNLVIVGLVALINALGYGIIIPILYTYSRRFGLSDFQNGLLFAIFSVFQFFATPIIGRMSDKYGRRPLLIGSLAGTAVSFFTMAFAPSAIFLFIARALDGATAGNLPVAQAIISDTTTPADRAKGFGIIGASFGFGFVLGPAISALTVGISPALPFIIAGAISVVSVIVTAMFLPETNKHMAEVRSGKLFDFKRLYRALFDPNVGVTFLISMFYSVAFSLFIYAFQPFSVKMLGLDANHISLMFTAIGVVGLVMQAVITQRVSKKYGPKNSFRIGLLIVACAFFASFFTTTYTPFLIAMMVMASANGLVQPLVSTILSRETDAKSQGTVLGLNASYMSIGQIAGPIIGGVIATIGIGYPFLAASGVVLLCLGLTRWILRPGVRAETTF